MEKAARFERVSCAQFIKDRGSFSEAEAKSIYNNIILPKRATVGSAGYDFYMPYDLTLKPGESALIPTGIRAFIKEGWVLMLFPRSGLGFKYRVQLNNTVGIIDSDYYGSSNEGHIMAKITNDGREGKEVVLKAGQGFIQGIFLPFGIVEGDDVTELRDGGFGSTTK